MQQKRAASIAGGETVEQARGEILSLWSALHTPCNVLCSAVQHLGQRCIVGLGMGRHLPSAKRRVASAATGAWMVFGDF